MSSLNDYMRQRHQVRQMRGTPTLHADDASAVREHASDHIVPFEVPRFPARPPRSVVGVLPQLDAHRRVSLARLAKACCWGPGTELRVVSLDGILELHPVAEPGGQAPLPGSLVGARPSVARRYRVRVDAQYRITFSPALCFALGVEPGDQVQVLSSPEGNYALVASLTQLVEVTRLAVALGAAHRTPVGGAIGHATGVSLPDGEVAWPPTAAEVYETVAAS